MSDLPALRWLHLTDLHVGNENDSQKVALTSLLAAIDRFSGGLPFDVVLLSGDLAYSGQRAQYDELSSLVVSPLRTSRTCANARFVATPGNHDLDCDVDVPPSWRDIGPNRQEKFFFFGDVGARTRGSRPLALREYQEFVRRCDIESVDPTTEPAKLISLTVRQRQISIISVVTTFFSDKERSDKHKAPAPLHPLRHLAQQHDTTTQLLVLGHHPPDWFIPETQQRLRSFLIDNNALYLHGHEHKVHPDFGSLGLTSLGFGAAYQASQDGPARPYYRNSFAICELADSLHVAVISWDAENGQWRPDLQLPGDFRERSSRLEDGYILPIPSTRVVERGRSLGSIGAAFIEDVRIDRCIWLADPGPKRWMRLLSTLGVVRNIEEFYTVPTRPLPQGHVEFRLKDGDSQLLVYAISAQGDVLNYEQLQGINTELDRQAYDGCIIVTLGELATEAQTLARQLAPRKSIQVLERGDIVRSTLRNLPHTLHHALRTSLADANLLAGCLIVSEAGFAFLLQEHTTNAWFQILDEDGNVAPESSDLVQSVRREQPNLRAIRYHDGNQAAMHEKSGDTLARRDFDRVAYLTKSHAFFDDVKYAPLAAVGFRFRKASLSEIYIEASADFGGATKTTHNLTQAVSEMVESLNLPKAQQEQLEAQLRSRYGLNRSAEVGAARKLYQRFNNVVVLGDPGSGKTCFIQYEILAYCAPPPEDATWYSRHLPIYVSLAEAARLLTDDTSLLDICSIVAARRGIELPRYVIEDAVAEGQAAFFFDGLDEVGHIDKRIALLAQIEDLVRDYSARGNRFVLASRPAAVQPVDIPEGLTYLRLKGLTEDEIRILAARVLTIRFGQSEDAGITDEERELVDRLLDDTRNEPGIARIARNPLLLTLLVLIYASSGALSARRHLIYTQAIKTLVSVRGRQTREQQISEADLRTRLGAIALAVFNRDITEIPRSSEVAHLLRPLMPRAEDESSESAANAFVQEVAEATGLLVINTKHDEDSDSLITFMHYSFLEYYAAAGLLAGNYLERVPKLAGNPRWKDVITLLFGLLSEHDDITPLLERILEQPEAEEPITQSRTLLALDCANECDVPPQETQEHLARAVFESVARGAGRNSAELRTEIAGRLDFLLAGASSRVERAIARGLTDRDAVAAAAFADLIARIRPGTPLSAKLIEAFNKFTTLNDPVARAAGMFAMERRPELRTEAAISCARRSLQGNISEKYAALRMATAVPGIVREVAAEITALLDDGTPLISVTAAQCLLVEALRGESVSQTPRNIEKVISRLQQQTGVTIDSTLEGVTLDKAAIQTAIFSGNATQSELAIRHLPVLREDSQFAYEVVTRRLRSAESPSLKAACIDALRVCNGVVDLLTIADTENVCEYLNDGHRNVRLAAIALLGEMPDDEQVVRSLQAHFAKVAASPSQHEELAESARALAKHVRRNQRLRAMTTDALLGRLPGKPTAGFGNAEQQRHTLALMTICEGISGVTNNKAAWRLHTLAINFRTPIELRQHSIRLFGRLVEPTARSIDEIIKMLEDNDPRLNEARYVAAGWFVVQCKRRVDYVRQVFARLPDLRRALGTAWRRETAQEPRNIDSASLRELREATIGIVDMMNSYDEFKDRTAA